MTLKKTIRDEAMPDSLKKAGETIGDFLGGRLRIIQKERGYRYSIDAVLLADFIRLKPGDVAVEFGIGSGIIPLILQHRFKFRKIIGIEIQEELADLARRNVLLNGLEGRIEIITGDVKKIRTICGAGACQAVFFNPPYRKMHSGRINPAGQKALARHEIVGSLADFLASASYALRARGAVYAVYPATRLVELMVRMRQSGVEPKRLRVVHSTASTAGEFVLVEGRKGGGEKLDVLPPLVIYREDGGYTGEVAAMLR